MKNIFKVIMVILLISLVSKTYLDIKNKNIIYAKNTNYSIEKNDNINLNKLKKLSSEIMAYQYIYENRNKLNNKLLNLAVNRKEALGYILGFLKNDRSLAPLSDDFVINSPLPLYLNWDRRWGYVSYEKDMIGTSGDLPSSFAMILRGLHKKSNPKEVANFFEKHCDINDNKFNDKDFLILEKKYGIKIKRINSEDIIKNLSQNSFVLLNLKDDRNLDISKVVALSSVDVHGDLIINDPNSIENSVKHWKEKDIKQNVKFAWVVNR